MRDPFAVVGRRLGMTAGQAWTSVLGLGLGAALLGTSLPPVLDQRNAVPPGVSPLVVRAGGYSTTDPVASGPSDPAGLPVSVRLGSPVETSYVRLSGTGTVLRLRLSDAQGAEVQPESAVVRACRITTPDWKAGRPQAAVPYSPSDCVPGRPQPDGGYAFDLTVYQDRTGPAGFALAADLSRRTSPGPTTYRITFVGQRTS